VLQRSSTREITEEYENKWREKSPQKEKMMYEDQRMKDTEEHRNKNESENWFMNW
jgi:hypothetical protein